MADLELTNFNGGELSPFMLGRPDSLKYSAGCKKLFNMIARVTGAAVRRPGTQLMGATKALAGYNTTLLPFEASTGSNTVLELGTGYMRFWDAATRAQILNQAGNWAPHNGGSTAELVSVISAGIPNNPVAYAQSNDVMWLCDGLHFPQKLSRIAQYKFQIANMGDGLHAPTPMKDLLLTETRTLGVSGYAKGASITVTASAALFTANMVGDYFHIETANLNTVTPWETGKSIAAAGNLRASNGNNYAASAAGTTGTSIPVHTYGTQSDGTPGVAWIFQDDNYGEFQITAFTNSTTVTATVIKQLPQSLVTTASTRWSRCAWNADDGYPTSVCFYYGRLCFARGQTIWCSVAGDFENFRFVQSGQVTSDLAIEIVLANQKNDRVLWLAVAPSGADLIAGTANGPYGIGPQSTNLVFGPGNVRATPASGVGCAPVLPVAVGDTLVFVQRGGRKVRALGYNANNDSYDAVDITAYASHVAQPIEGLASGGFTRLVAMRQPDPVVWGCGNILNNQFYGMTYDQAQQVYGWHSHALGGPAPAPYPYPDLQDMAVVIGPDGVNDDVWMAVARDTITEACYLEVMGPTPDIHGNGYYYSYTELPDVSESWYLDCAVVSSIAAGTTTATVPANFAYFGTPVSALVEGYTVPDNATLVSSAFSVPYTSPNARKCLVGYNYTSILHTMPLHQQTQMGVSERKRSKMVGAMVRVYNTVGFNFGDSETGKLDREEMRRQSSNMDTAVPLQSGDYYMLNPGGSHGGRDDPNTTDVVITQDQPLPLTVLAIFPDFQVSV